MLGAGRGASAWGAWIDDVEGLFAAVPGGSVVDDADAAPLAELVMLKKSGPNRWITTPESVGLGSLAMAGRAIALARQAIIIVFTMISGVCTDSNISHQCR